MTAVHVFVVPYDSGAACVRMGAGPDGILEAGLGARLENAGHALEITRLQAPAGPLQAEIASAFALASDLAVGVRRARKDGAFPIVLAGNCLTSVGTIAGMGDGVGVLWFDSHGDLNTPETTASGFLDGMALSVVMGLCWRSLASVVPGFGAVGPEDVVLVGTRDLDPPEEAAVAQHALRVLHPREASQGIVSVVDAFERAGRELYVHLDLDAMDPGDGRANQFAVEGGLSLDELRGIFETVGRRGSVGALAVTAYDPAFDVDGRASAAAVDLVVAAVNVVSARRAANG